MRTRSRTAFLFLLTVGCGIPPRGSVERGQAAPDAGAPVSVMPEPTHACSNLECRQVQCGELQSSTTLTGTIFAPNGTLPLYGATIYVPNAPVDALPTGAQCGRCDATLSGSPIVQTQSGPDGRFQLANVPAGDDVPLVVQLGRWRRLVTIAHVEACATTALDPDATRLPRNASEGEIPRIAIATGALDPMECLLLKVGIDAAEMGDPGAGGRVEMYRAANHAGTSPSAGTPSAADPVRGLYTNLSRLAAYDMVLLPCEGEPFEQDAIARKNLAEYVDAGGRLFTTHYSYDWLTYPSSPFNKVADPLLGGQWPTDQRDYPSDDSAMTVARIDTSSPKGAALARWMQASGASSPEGELYIEQLRHDLNGVDPRYAETWAQASFGGVPGVAHMSFNTPLEGEACGRVTFSDFHVSASEAKGTQFPSACVPGPLTDQERALAFLLFDLSACVEPIATTTIY